jgi:DNA-binding transcriptional MerR regulator
MREELLSAGEVARRLGIAVTTLRTWHQRYTLGPSHHEPGHHRRYTPDDLDRLETMRQLTARGVPAATAARVAQGGAPESGIADRDGGGHTIPVGRAGPAARGLARAAVRLDDVTMRATIAAAIASNGVVPTWDTLICPVLRGLGGRHTRNGTLVDVEHLFSRCVSEALSAVPRPPGPATVLLACTDEEQHTLPLEALAASLAQCGTASRLLGGRVPPSALMAAVRRTGPRAVVLWSHSPATADPGQLEELLEHRPVPTLLVAGGPGWVDRELPAPIRTPAALAAAVHLIGTGAGPHRVSSKVTLRW